MPRCQSPDCEGQASDSSLWCKPCWQRELSYRLSWNRVCRPEMRVPLDPLMRILEQDEIRDDLIEYIPKKAIPWTSDW